MKKRYKDLLVGRKCPNCGRPIPVDSTKCIYCRYAHKVKEGEVWQAKKR